MGEAFYITREGAKRLQDELAALRATTRPKIVVEVADAAAQGDRSENAEYIYGKKKLREIDRRIHWLTKRLETVTVVDSQREPDFRRLLWHVRRRRGRRRAARHLPHRRRRRDQSRPG